MASIYGFTLKNRKTFQGLDWQGNQGDLWYKGKKVAWYNDSGNGGSCDIVYYDNAYAPILEETIKRYFKERPIITEYGEPFFDRNGQPIKIKVGMALISLAIKENKANTKYIALLEETKKYFSHINNIADENGRNKVLHGHLHPRFWSKESFEDLIEHIAKLSKYSQF